MRLFSQLEQTGFLRSDLQLAWDFVVASKESTPQKLIHMRDDAQVRHDNGETGYTILRSIAYSR